MANSQLPRLRLKGNELVDPKDDRSIELAIYDVQLPCRKYRINHKVAVLGRVSLTAEFLLRLVKTTPGIFEDDAAIYFGFTRREMAFVLREAEEPGYVERRDGRLWLTADGQGLFREDTSEPQIFSVEQRSQDYCFDLIALAPQAPQSMGPFELKLPELTISDEERAGSAARRIPEAFSRFYFDLANRADRLEAKKKDLYSIDSVEAKQRLPGTVRVTLRAQASTPTVGEGDLSLWRPDHEQEDRPEIIGAVAAFVDTLKSSRRSDDSEAYQVLLDLAPEFLKDFARKDGLAVERFYRESLSRVGEVRADRKTVPVLGSLLLPPNRDRLLASLEYGSRERSFAEPQFLLWLSSQVPHWGATKLLDDTIRGIQHKISMVYADVDEGLVTSLGLISGRPPRYLERAFEKICAIGVSGFPTALEILLIPRVSVAAIVHAPIGAQSGHPVPLGILSFDETVLDRAQDYLLRNIGTCIADTNTLKAIETELSKEISASSHSDTLAPAVCDPDA